MPDSPTQRLARSVGAYLPPAPGPVCEVCDNTLTDRGDLTVYAGDVTTHEGCAPGPWRDDLADRDRFMAEVADWRDQRAYESRRV